MRVNNEELAMYLPAIDNMTGPSESLSDRYSFIPTRPIVGALVDQGFSVVRTSQGATKSPYAKHIVSFEQTDAPLIEIAPGDYVRLRADLVNAHNGTAAICLHSGIYRHFCANGMVFGDSGKTVSSTIRLRHLGVALDNFLAGVHIVLRDAKDKAIAMQEMARVPMTYDQQIAFADEAIRLRWDESTHFVNRDMLLHPRRHEDAGDNLWLVYQRVQEKLIKGGVRIANASTERVTRSRELKSIDRSIKVNTGLWEIAHRYLEAA